MNFSFLRSATATVGAFLLIASAAQAQTGLVNVKNSPDSAPGGSGLPNMNLKTLLNNAGVYSYIFADPALNGGNPSDQILERAFIANNNGLAPVVEVLFNDSVRTSAAGYKPYHRIGWYQRTDGQTTAPVESSIKDVVWENGAAAIGNTNNTQKLVTNQADFAGLDLLRSFELRLTSSTSGDSRGGSIYSDDALNASNFRNILFMKERDASGNLVNDSYIVAWEDLRGGGDEDYQDMVVRVKYVAAVTPGTRTIPEPGTLALLVGGSLIGTLVVKRKRS